MRDRQNIAIHVTFYQIITNFKVLNAPILYKDVLYHTLFLTGPTLH